MWELFPEAASTLAGKVDRLFLFAVAVTAFFSALIAGLILYLGIRFRRRRVDQVGEPERAALALEVTWCVVPLGIALFLFVWGAQVFFEQSRPPAGATTIYVTGRQWMWQVQHGSGRREINELHVPRDRPVRLLMTSQDVIHSFFVPAFRIKQDVLPDRFSALWFQATRAGSWHLFCAEYCGAEHSRMIGRVVVLEPQEYERWLEAGDRAALPGGATGEQLFEALGCAGCHRGDTLAKAPLLAGLFGSRVALADGSEVVADEAYLRESILFPSAKVVAGYQPLMPGFRGRITEDQLLELVRHLKTAKNP
jgi:cytochrome c oxidase subunit 2